MSKMSCPSCGAGLEPVLIGPLYDKHLKCSHCDTLLDVPDESTIRRVEEEGPRVGADGWTVRSRRETIVTRRDLGSGSPDQASGPGSAIPGAGSMQAQLDRLFQGSPEERTRFEEFFRTFQSGAESPSSHGDPSLQDLEQVLTEARGRMSPEMAASMDRMFADFGSGAMARPPGRKGESLSSSRSASEERERTLVVDHDAAVPEEEPGASTSPGTLVALFIVTLFAGLIVLLSIQ